MLFTVTELRIRAFVLFFVPSAHFGILIILQNVYLIAFSLQFVCIYIKCLHCCVRFFASNQFLHGSIKPSRNRHLIIYYYYFLFKRRVQFTLEEKEE